MSEEIKQGLRGLKGLQGLTKAQVDAFINRNRDLISQHHYDPVYINQLYANKQFVDRYGIEKFKAMPDTKSRNALYKAGVVTDAFVQRFGKDKDFNIIAPQLDTDGMYDLLTNDEYLGYDKRQKKYNSLLKAAKNVGKTYNNAIQNPYVDAIGQGWMQVGKTASALAPIEQFNEDSDNDNKILEKLYAETQQRRENSVQGDSDILYNTMLAMDDQGKKSIGQYLKEFDKVNNIKGSYYNRFKNSKWLSDYSAEDKLKDYSKYLAIKQQYGEGIAQRYLNNSIQNRIADAQDGKWTGNTLKGVLTSAWSDLGSEVAMMNYLGKSVDEIAILNQGKDPKKPIYGKNGEIVDYQWNDNIWTNPAYWNNVYKYNTFSPTEIRAIEEQGGISEDVNVRRYGYVPDFLSWDTAEEGFKQTGHLIAPIVTTALTGGAGKAVGWGLKTTLKGLGVSTKALATASKIGAATNDILVMAASGASGAQLESMGTFDEQLQKAKEKIQDQITRELYDYQSTIDYNSKEAQSAINTYYRQLKASDTQRIALRNSEGTRAFPMSDEILKEQAKQMYTNKLLGAKEKELQVLHKKDEKEAAKDAARTYCTNFALDFIKEMPINAAIQKFKIAKGSLRGAFDNTIKENIVADASSGGVRRAFTKMKDKATGKLVDNPERVKSLISGRKLTKELGKQFLGGYMDEYLDGINASFAGAIGSQEFDNYIKKTYDPKAYKETVDTMLGNLLTGISGAIDGITDRENLYEGFIGGISPLTTVMVNANAAFHPKDTWRALRKGEDAYGNKLNKAERLNSIFMNPLLNTYAELKEKDRGITRVVKAINDVVAANKDKVEDASKIISVLNNYDSPIKETNIDGIPTASLLDSKDDKLFNAFTIIRALNGLESIEGGTISQLYKDTMHTIEGLANGTLSKEEMDNEIDRALADKDNKSILEDVNNREEAAERLQKNAQYFMGMKKKMSEVEEVFANSPSLKNTDPRVKTMLMYNLVASEDYEKRLQSLEEGLEIGKTDSKTLYTPDYNLRYGTEEAKERAVKGREREITQIHKELDELSKKDEESKEKIGTLKQELKMTSNTDKIKKIRKEIEEQKNLIKARAFNRKALKESLNQQIRDKVSIETSINKKGGDKESVHISEILDEETILNADARDRAAILDPRNRDNYSEGQQLIIDRVTEKLKQKDPEALTKILDAGTLANRVEDMSKVYNKILKNNDLASIYLDVTEDVRFREAQAESLQKQIESTYGDIDAAYNNRESDPEGFKRAVVNENTSSRLLKAYMEDNPEKADAIKPYYELMEFTDDAKAVIVNGEDSMESKIAQITTLLGLQDQSNSREELESKIEGLIDSPDIDDGTKNIFERLMSKMSMLGYSRDATVLENRKERLQREEKERKKKEEEKKKVEEEAKKAAEKEVEKREKENAEEKKEEENIFEESSCKPQIDMSKEIDNASIEEIAAATGKTEEEVKRAVAELRTEHNKTKYEGYSTPSSALGNTADIIVRDFFAGELKDSYPNITKEVLQHFIEQLEEFKKELDKKGIHIVSKEVMAHGMITAKDENGNEHKVAVAGTLDLFGYDDKGRYYIFDMKTTRSHTERKLRNEQLKWSRQVSTYADLLKQIYGIDVYEDNLRIIPINVFYPRPKGEGEFMDPNGPEYSIDKKSGQLKMTDTDGKTTDFVQDKTKDFEMRSTKLKNQFQPGYTHIEVNWDFMTSKDQDTVNSNPDFELDTYSAKSKSPQEVIKKIIEDTQDFVLSEDETYYYVRDKNTGIEIRYARVTSLIAADKHVPQWYPTNAEVYEHLTGKKASDIENTFNEQEKENAQQGNEISANGNNVTSNAPTDRDHSKAELIGRDSGIWSTDMLMDDEMGDESIDAGEMWYGDKEDAHKGKVNVERNGNTITFSLDEERMALNITPEEYEKADATETPQDNENKENKESKENGIFKATSLEKKGDEWYFNGSFAGNNETTQVKVKDNFSIDDAIERQRNEKEAELATQGVDIKNVNIIDNGDSVEGKSETIKEQAESVKSTENALTISDKYEDADDVNRLNQDKIDNDEGTLSGNAMSEYVSAPLRDSGIIKHKKGDKPNDRMNQYYDWMKAAGIKLQNIIDQELARIIKRNPNAKVKFMAVRTDRNATNDIAMQHHLLLVLDYDNSINKGITGIHNDANGGVIESNGKKYLVIGVVGYGKRNASKLALYDILWNSNLKGGINLKKQRKQFFDEHPSERFYVNEDISTEIVPGSQIPGYRVRQGEEDSHSSYRSVRELLADKKRNPQGYDMESVAWGIQERTQFLIIGASADNVMVPKNKEKNMGSAFVLIPASNGKLMPSYLKVLKYVEMRDGALKERVDELLQDVTSLNYATRYDALTKLSNIFYFDKKGDTISSREDKNEISLVHDGEVFKTFNLEHNFDRKSFMDAVMEINPRINITARVLTDSTLLKEYDEAGALMTDAALFGTAGSSYSIYGLDSEGRMIKKETPSNTISTTNNSDFRNGDARQIIFNHQYYREADGVFTLDGKTVTDENIIKQLEYNKRILESELTPAERKGVWSTYILSEGENPEVVRVNRNTKEVKVVPEKQAKEIVEKVKEEKEKKLREEAAQRGVEDALKEGVREAKDVNLGIEDNGMIIDPETGEIVQNKDEGEGAESPETTATIEDSESSSTKSNPPTTGNISVPLTGSKKAEGTQTFKDLMKNMNYAMRVFKLIREKWADAPKSKEDIEKFLRDKNVEVDIIGTSKADVEAWIKTIEDCR